MVKFTFLFEYFGYLGVFRQLVDTGKGLGAFLQRGSRNWAVAAIFCKRQAKGFSLASLARTCVKIGA
jgi:hypothetical protein